MTITQWKKEKKKDERILRCISICNTLTLTSTCELPAFLLFEDEVDSLFGVQEYLAARLNFQEITQNRNQHPPSPQGSLRQELFFQTMCHLHHLRLN